MENQGLVVILEIFFNHREESVGKITVLGKLLRITEVNNVEIGLFGGVFGFDV